MKGELCSLWGPGTPDPPPAVQGTVWVKTPTWRGDIPTKFGGNALVIGLHCLLKDFRLRPGSKLQDVGVLGERCSVQTPSFQSWQALSASTLAASVWVRYPHPMLGFCPGGCLLGSPLPRGRMSMASTNLKGAPLSYVTALARSRAFLGCSQMGWCWRRGE